MEKQSLKISVKKKRSYYKAREKECPELKTNTNVFCSMVIRIGMCLYTKKIICYVVTKGRLSYDF